MDNFDPAHVDIMNEEKFNGGLENV